MKTNSKVLVCYNSPVSIFSVYNGKPEKSSLTSKDLSENGFTKELGIITRSLEENFLSVDSLPISGNIEKSIAKITEFNPDVIFNFVESIE